MNILQPAFINPRSVTAPGGMQRGGAGRPRAAPVPVSQSGNRVTELMDLLKLELEHFTTDQTMVKRQRDEFEMKLEAQLTELKTVMSAVSDLEARHSRAVTAYQDEIRMLRAELEKRGGVPATLLQGSLMGSAAPVVGKDGAPAAKRQRTETAVFPPLVGLKSTPAVPSKEGVELSKMGNGKPMKPVGSDLATAPTSALQPLPKPAAESTPWSLSTKLATPKVSLAFKHQLTHDSAVCSVRFSNSGQHLATGCKKAAFIYDVSSGEKTGMYSIEPECYIRSVCFSPDDRQLVTGAEDFIVRVYEVATQRVLHTLKGHTMEIFSVDWTSNGQYIVSGSGDKSIRLWEADGGKCVYTLVNPKSAETAANEEQQSAGITCVSVSPDNQIIAAGSLDNSVRFWGISKGNFLGEFSGAVGHQDSVYAVAFSPDGKFLASGSLDETLRLWDLSSLSVPRCQATFSGHKGWVLSIAFTPDGKWLLSGSKDLTLRFWDYRTPGANEPVAVLNRPKEWNSVIGISVSPKGNYFATGSGDYKGRIWEYKDPAPTIS